MYPHNTQIQKHITAQQFLASQFCPKTDKIRLQNLIPVQLHENCFQRKHNETQDQRSSPPHLLTHGIKPSQKPSQTSHKPNMSLQNRSNISEIQEKINQFSKRRDYSPNQETIKFLLKSNKKQENEQQQTPNHQKYISKSPSPMEIKESVAHLLSNKSSRLDSDISSPKNQKPKTCVLQLGPYLTIQQQNSKSSQKSKGHSSANSVSYGTNNMHKQSGNLIKKNEYGITHTPTKFTTTTQNTEHSKSKSVVEDQLQYMKMYFEKDKENDTQIMNIGTPSTYLTSKISLDQQSVNNKQYQQLNESTRQQFLKTNTTTTNSQQSPPFQKALMSTDQLQESFPIRTCFYHRTKKAKYMAEEEGRMQYYCSKCAVKYASQKGQIFEINLVKSHESQVQSFQASSIESNRQSTIQEVQYKEREMNIFLAQISESQVQRADILQQLQIQCQRVNDLFDGQIKECNEQKQSLQKLLNEAHNRAVSILQTQKQQSMTGIQQWFTLLQEHQVDSKNIQNDIEKNWNGVLEIQMEKFVEVLSFYSAKLQQMDNLSTQAQRQEIHLKYLAQSDLQATMSLIAQNFELQDQTVPLINQKQNSEEDLAQFGYPIRTQPTPPKKREEHQLNQNRIKTDCSASKQKKQDENPQNFCQYFYEKQQPDLMESKQSSKAQASNSTHSNNLYVSFENKDIFMNALEAERSNKQSIMDNDPEFNKQQAIMILQSYRGSHAEIEEEPLNSSRESAKSTPHSPASGQTKQSFQRTATKTPELEEQFQIPKDAFQKPKSTFRTLFENEEQPMEKGSSSKKEIGVSPGGSEKYRSFLNRISDQQSKTQQFYQQVIQSNPKFLATETPDIKKYELSDTETCKKAILSNQESLQFKDSGLNLCDDQQDPSEYGNDDDEYDLEVRRMFGSKEMKQSEQKQNMTLPSDSSNNTSSNVDMKKDIYQKTLFCSPAFKDHDILNISDSSCDAIM